MIVSFKNHATQGIFNGISTKDARKACPQELWRIAARKLDQLDSVVSLEELRIPPGNHLEALEGDRKGQMSVRINKQYRICFIWSDNGPSDIEMTDYH